MKQAMILFIATSTLINLSSAEDLNDNVQYEKLCSYDTMCTRLKNADGSYVKPKAGLIKVMQAMRDPIQDISDKLGVDSTAVAGSILAENSMNVQIDGDTHAFLETIKLNPLANDLSKLLRGKSFSLGFGQIKPETAEEAEEVLAKLESRETRSPEEIKRALLDPLENVRLVAAIVRQCQDAYQRYGFDVSKDPAVLASLYNLGGCAARAAAAKASDRAPRVNFFGHFVRHYRDEIVKGVGLKGKGSEENRGSTPPVTLAAATRSLNRRLTGDVTVSGFPPKCDTEGAGQLGEYKKFETISRSDQLKLARGEYTVLSPGIDCDLNDWSLIKTSRGDVGWISNSVLDLNSEEFVKVERTKHCDEKIREACVDKLKAQLGKDFIGFDENGLMEIKLVGGRQNPSEPNLKKFNASTCLQKSGLPGSGNVVSASVAQAYLKRFDRKKDEIVAGLQLKDWDDPKNVYAEAYGQVKYSVENNCKSACSGDTDALELLLNSKPTDYQGFAGLQAYKAQFVRNPTFWTAPIPVGIQERGAIWDRLLVDSSRECRPLLNQFPNARKELLKFEKDVDLKRASGLPNNEINYSNSTDVPAMCRGIKDAMATRTREGPDANIDLKEDQCPRCSFYSTLKGPTGSSFTSINFQEALRYTRSLQDYDELLALALKSATKQVQGNLFGDAECEYDPTATATKIGKLSEDSCVDSVFAPDRYLVNRFSGRKGGIFYKPYASDDRFSISLKDGCARIDTAEASGPIVPAKTGSER